MRLDITAPKSCLPRRACTRRDTEDIQIRLSSCTDSELDPLQRDKLKKGSILALRGQSVDNIADENFVGGIDSFNVLGDNSNTSFSFTCDFLSESIANLSSVDVYVVAKGGNRVKVKNVLASAFQPATGSNFNRTTITLTYAELIAASGYVLCDFKPSDPQSGAFSGFLIQNDLNLSDGTIVPSSAIVNTSLSESTLLFPAHNLRITARGPVSPPVKAFLASGTELIVDLEGGISFKWTATDNPNVSGEILSGTGTPLLGGTLTNLTSKKQSVVYSVTPTLSNGCEGLPYTITTAFCNASELGGTFNAKMSRDGSFGTGSCTATWEGTVRWEEVSEGVYKIYSTDNGVELEDFSMGAYYACYGANAQNQMPLGDLRYTHQCDKLGISGKSQWGEAYTITELIVAGKDLTISWVNDYGEAGTTVLTRTDGNDWPSSIFK